jgi:2-hydroxycyclohexanecarboxyl-CoA dehydrogenase
VSLYGAAKAGSIALMKHLAHEVGPLGVTCNALALGLMDGVPADPSRIPIPRLGTGRDVGAAVAFLSSAGGDWITGQVLAVNGGAVT